MKLFFVDTETTGVEHDKHGLWQIAAQVRIDGAEVERFDLQFQPIKGKLVSAEALEKSRKTVDDLRKLQAPQLAFAQLKRTLAKHVDKYDKKDKMFFVGYNAQFDSQFVRRWFEDHGDQYYGSWFWYPYVDVAQLAGFALMRQRTRLENFKLGTVCKYFGVQFDDGAAHDAQYDIDRTRELFDLLVANGLRVFDEVE